MPCPAHHPQQTLREFARKAIADYTQPGDLVIDPSCGSGDILVEAIKANRMAIGVEPEKYLADIARRRIEMASGAYQQSGYGAVVHGDPSHIADLVGRDVQQRAALIIAPPHSEIIINQCRTLLRPDGHLVIVTDSPRPKPSR